MAGSVNKVILVGDGILGLDQCQNRMWWDRRYRGRISCWHIWIRKIDDFHAIDISAFDLRGVVNMAEVHIALFDHIEAREMRAIRCAGGQAIQGCARDSCRHQRIGDGDIVERELARVDHLESIADRIARIREAIAVHVIHGGNCFDQGNCWPLHNRWV